MAQFTHLILYTNYICSKLLCNNQFVFYIFPSTQTLAFSDTIINHIKNESYEHKSNKTSDDDGAHKTWTTRLMASCLRLKSVNLKKKTMDQRALRGDWSAFEMNGNQHIYLKIYNCSFGRNMLIAMSECYFSVKFSVHWV